VLSRPSGFQDEHKAKTPCYDAPVWPGQKCVVSFRGPEGVEHVAEVLASSLYEAGALALQQFRRGDWSREASLDAGTFRVEVCESNLYNLIVACLGVGSSDQAARRAR
jgi:hypothetical protein